MGFCFCYYGIKKELSFLYSKEEILPKFKIIFVGMTGINLILCFYFPNSGLKYWIEKSETPFWIGIKDNNWDYSAEIKEKLVGLRNFNINQTFIGKHAYTYILLYLPLKVDEATVINKIVIDIRRIFNSLCVCK